MKPCNLGSSCSGFEVVCQRIQAQTQISNNKMHSLHSKHIQNTHLLFSTVMNMKNNHFSSTKIYNTLYQNTVPVMLRELHQQYKEKFIIQMNEVANKFISHLFASKKKQPEILNPIHRSSIPGWIIHSGKTTTVVSLERTVYTCHTVSKKKSRDAPDCGKSQWKAVLQQVGAGAFSFEISDFNMHRMECVQHFAHFTPDEVSFQMHFKPSGRLKVMQQLHQNQVQQETYKNESMNLHKM